LLEKEMPCVLVPERYRRTLFTALQCSVVGWCINCDSLLTAKEMSGLVRDKYCRLPTAMRYCVGSSIAGPELSERVVCGHIGVEIDLALDICIRWSKSVMYLC